MKLNVKRTLITAALTAAILTLAHVGIMSVPLAALTLLFGFYAGEVFFGQRTSMAFAAVTPTFLMDFESNMKVIAVNEYARMLKNLWLNRVVKTLTSNSKKEVIGWLLDTATISDQGLGGNVQFEDMSMIEQTVVNFDSGKGLTMRKQQFEDLDGRGVQIGTKWAADIGAYMAYWPQKQAANLLKNGTTTVAYDGKNLFSKGITAGTAATDGHPFNPLDPGAGVFANWFTGSPSGSYPGACPIDPTNAATVDVAFQNLNKVIAYIRGNIRMPSGQDPRFLKPTCILHPPFLAQRVQQITNARFIAQAAGSSGGGAGDIEAVIANYGFGVPIQADELSTSNGGDDLSYYVVCEEIAAGDQLGAIIYQNREPYSIVFHTPAEMSELARSQTLQWICHGRNATAPGHPYMIFKVSAT